MLDRQSYAQLIEFMVTAGLLLLIEQTVGELATVICQQGADVAL